MMVILILLGFQWRWDLFIKMSTILVNATNVLDVVKAG